MARAPVISRTLEKDDFPSNFTWNLKNFCAMVGENSFKSNFTTTQKIPIQGIPFKWQLGMTTGENIFDDDQRENVPAVRFDLNFIGEEPALEKYVYITCCFDIGEYWTGKTVLTNRTSQQVDNDIAQQSGWIKQSVLKANVNSEGTLAVECRMNVNAYYWEIIVVGDTTNCLTKLHKEIGELPKSEKLSDLTIVVSDQEFKVHKKILAARSPVFSLMLETNMKEKLESRIEIPDVSSEAVKAFLKFLYTAEVTPTPHWKDLLNLAGMYQIEDLKKICEQNLIFRLNEENAQENLKLARLHNCEELMKKAFEVILPQILSGEMSDPLICKPEYVKQLKLSKLKYDKLLQKAKNGEDLDSS